MTHTILVIEDEVSIQNVVRVYLEHAGFEVICVDNGQEGLAQARALQPTLIVLDLNLPGIDGMEVAARLRQESDVYILMLTARGTEDDRIVGLKMGADDYLTKPFSPRELVARVEAILRRRRDSGPRSANKLTFEHVSINLSAHEAQVNGRLLELTATEFDVLHELARHHGHVLTRNQLLTNVWGSNFYGNDRVVDVYVGQVRRKLQELAGITLIETVRGVGYKFVDTKV